MLRCKGLLLFAKSCPTSAKKCLNLAILPLSLFVFRQKVLHFDKIGTKEALDSHIATSGNTRKAGQSAERPSATTAQRITSCSTGVYRNQSAQNATIDFYKWLRMGRLRITAKFPWGKDGGKVVKKLMFLPF